MITLHGVHGSPFVRAIRIALAEKDLPWAWAPFPLGAHKQEPYISLHPFGKIPAIVDDGFALYETNAILRHIDRTHPSPPLTPPAPRRAARMDQFLCILDSYFWPNVSRTIGFNRLIAPRIGVPVDEAVVTASVPHARTALQAIAALQDAPFLTGDSLTLADIALLPHLSFLERTPEGAALLPAHPGIAAWLALMRTRKSVADSARPPEAVPAPAEAVSG